MLLVLVNAWVDSMLPARYLSSARCTIFWLRPLEVPLVLVLGLPASGISLLVHPVYPHLLPALSRQLTIPLKCFKSAL
jgi:hypothetical protein